ncbi:DUF1549 domain-containing protein [Roseiconus nitratireducens]|uniref:DUF1549 domain-containing protein n=2 Tax=Roseiconus nitratireducens TaxID=2605748 RepID=A0A5M6DAY1_9BACT|nr:DUF1549 domain-containing protein [Roseiconus nitratireducens]
MPLLGRLGCNGRSCHGSFQGRGDFRLSLFGYDFSGDHEALLAEDTGRVDPDDVDESLILAKPTDEDMHEGGKRFDRHGWEYRVLRNWIAAGAKFQSGSVQTLESLEIQPAEIRVDQPDQNIELKAIAHWEDGSAEDVTPLCRFSTNDESIAAINEQGVVTSGETGDTHVVVYYDNAVVPVLVIRPLEEIQIAADQSVADRQGATAIDRLIEAKLNKLGIIPSARCTDAEFIRRVSLDITGILPSGEEVREFLADESPTKRTELVDRLLESPAYAAWWATRMSDWTGNNAEQMNNVLPVRNVSTRLWFEWLRTRLEANVPYDQIIEGIVTAETRQEGESYLEYCEEMTKACAGEPERFAKRDGMPLFWARRNFQKPEERAIGFAYTFLGVRIECAQCHKHPFDQWSKNDFDEFAKLFTPIRAGNANQIAPESRKTRDELVEKLTGGKELKGGDLRRAVAKAARDGEVVPFGELVVNVRGISPQERQRRAKAKKAGRTLPPARVPGGKILGLEEEIELSEDPRPALMQWLRDESNPYFAKAIVNRVWSNYFGVGIVDPTDDMNLANPPSNAALLDHLANEFIRHDFDLKWLHREIVASDAYQRSAQTNASNLADRTNFSHHLPRRMPAEVVFDMVALATGSTSKAEKMRDDLDKMAIAEANPRLRNQSTFALDVFGQSIRETNCDCDRSDAPSLLQSIYLRNDEEMYRRIADRDGWVAEICAEMGLSAPQFGADPRQTPQQRAADALRRQVISRVKQFNRLPEDRQSKMRPQLEAQYKKLARRMKSDYQVPPLKKLIANPDSWSELSPVGLRTGEGDQDGVATSLSDVVQEAYLRTLSRFPDEEESEVAVQYIRQSENPTSGLEGLMWALVNTKEFIISH